MVMEPWIYFDIDLKDDLPGAREAAVQVIAELYEAGFGLEFMYASFSGNKGFHICVSSAYLGLPYFDNASHAHGTLKRFFHPLIERYPLDPKPMSPLVPIRLTNSRHDSSGCRKWTMKAYDFAKETKAVEYLINRFGPHSDETLTMDMLHRSDTLVTLFRHPHKAIRNDKLARQFAGVWEDTRSCNDTNNTEARTSDGLMPPTTYKAFKGVSKSTEWAVGHVGRDEAAFVLACFWRKDGMSPERTLDLLQKWDRQRNDPPLQEDPEEHSDILLQKVNSATRHLFHDGDIDTLNEL
jgi:hypothetical protein